MHDYQIIAVLLPWAAKRNAVLLNTPGGFAAMPGQYGVDAESLQKIADADGIGKFCKDAYGIPLWTIPWQQVLPPGYQYV